jgi:hypothetical protein
MISVSVAQEGRLISRSLSSVLECDNKGGFLRNPRGYLLAYSSKKKWTSYNITTWDLSCYRVVALSIGYKDAVPAHKQPIHLQVGKVGSGRDQGLAVSYATAGF